GLGLHAVGAGLEVHEQEASLLVLGRRLPERAVALQEMDACVGRPALAVDDAPGDRIALSEPELEVPVAGLDPQRPSPAEGPVGVGAQVVIARRERPELEAPFILGIGREPALVAHALRLHDGVEEGLALGPEHASPDREVAPALEVTATRELAGHE